MTATFTPTRLACSHGPDLWFDGKLIGQYSTQRKDGGKDRWTELRLWETPAGNWVAESVGCSTRENEGVIREARVIERPVSVRLVRPDRQGETVRILTSPAEVDAAMDAWNWTTAAKAFARELGWDVVRRVE
ncbi:MAG: hypothetical protein QOH47_2434 [Sphingomonadales bacterium]|jgi:hypothetical protein|nr:hypothetical protein [Sphingomonadales bacterium]